jgi:hypothetical protein
MENIFVGFLNFGEEVLSKGILWERPGGQGQEKMCWLTGSP